MYVNSTHKSMGGFFDPIEGLQKGLDYIRYIQKAKQNYRTLRGYYIDGVTPKTTYQDIYIFGTLLVILSTNVWEDKKNAPGSEAWLNTLLRENDKLTKIANNALKKYDTGYRTASSDENKTFWNQVNRVAINLGGESVTPTKLDLAVESVVESVKDRIGDIKDAFKALPKIFDWVQTTIKWVAIGLAAYFGLRIFEGFKKKE
jgi:hypothetical protein